MIYVRAYRCMLISRSVGQVCRSLTQRGSSSRLGVSLRSDCVPGICRVAPLKTVWATGDPCTTSIGKLQNDRGWGVTPIRNYGAAGVARHALAALWVGHVGAAFWEEVAHVPVEVLVLNAAGEDKISARAVRPPRAWGQNRQVDRQAFSRTTQSVRQASCSS